MSSDFIAELRNIIHASSDPGDSILPDTLQQCQCSCTKDQFKDFCCNKAFEVIGDDNQYKRYFSTCKENAEQWAIKVHNSITKVTADIKSVQAMVENLQTQGKEVLYKLCLEIMASSTQPIRKRSGWHICSISGTRSDSCVEVGRRGKDTSSIIIHQKFTSFVLYMWFCCKIEHIIKNQVRVWITKQDTDEVHRLCQLFQENDELINRWYEIFKKSVLHVKLSIIMESKSPLV